MAHLRYHNVATEEVMGFSITAGAAPHFLCICWILIALKGASVQMLWIFIARILYNLYHYTVAATAFQAAAACSIFNSCFGILIGAAYPIKCSSSTHTTERTSACEQAPAGASITGVAVALTLELQHHQLGATAFG